MNLDYYIKKKHIFKNRRVLSFKFKTKSKSTFRFIYSVKKTRLEFVYVRLFKKLFRRKFIKAKTRFFKPKFWILLLPNYILTQKSKNARMGAGVGKFVRLVNIVFPGKTIIKTWYYTYNYLRAITNYMLFKIPNKFLVKKCYK